MKLGDLSEDRWIWRDQVWQEVSRTGDPVLGRLLPVPGNEVRILMKAVLVERMFERMNERKKK